MPRRSPRHPGRRRCRRCPGRSAGRRRRRAWSRCRVMRVPLAASGWPMAMAPPSTLVRSRSRPSSRSTARYWAENASLTSIRSIWSSVMPALASALRAAGAGPMPMYFGSTPATRPRHQAADRLEPGFAAASLAITTAAAPSQMPEAFPAVTTPSFLKYGGSLASASTVVSGRMCSSAAQARPAWSSGSGPGPARPRPRTRPTSHASRARCWLRRA